MPWRREEVAPYSYDDVYIPSTTGKFYYSTYERTQEEMDDIYRRNNGREPRPWEQKSEPSAAEKSSQAVEDATWARRDAMARKLPQEEIEWEVAKVYARHNGWPVPPHPSEKKKKTMETSEPPKPPKVKIAFKKPPSM